jgi:hypothetical protein
VEIPQVYYWRLVAGATVLHEERAITYPDKTTGFSKMMDWMRAHRDVVAAAKSVELARVQMAAALMKRRLVASLRWLIARLDRELPVVRLHVRYDYREGFRRTEVLAVDEQTGKALCNVPVESIRWTVKAGDFTHADLRVGGVALDASMRLDDGRQAVVSAVPTIPGRRAKAPDVRIMLDGEETVARGAELTLHFPTSTTFSIVDRDRRLRVLLERPRRPQPQLSR